MARLVGLTVLVGGAGVPFAGGGQVAPLMSVPGNCGPMPPMTCVTRWTCGIDGFWVPTYRPAGYACNDGAACTYNDRCDGAGSCAGTSISCTNDQCNTRACNGTATCAVTPKASGTACNDGQACTYNDVCNGAGSCAGTAISCTGDQCNDRACNGTSTCTVTPRPAGTACNDTQACTYNDVCNGAGICSGTSISCSDDQCSTRACNGTSSCAVTPKAAGTPCSDGNLCTYGETCSAGVCGGGTVKACDPNARCGPESCNGTSSCTVTPTATDDGDPCTADACDPVHGVTHAVVPGCSQAAGGPPIVAPYPDASPPGGMPMAPGLAVDESTGTFNYAYRFDLPRARGRFQASLNLSYKHTRTRDLGTGTGWSLEGPLKRSWERDPSTGTLTREWVEIGGSRVLMVVGPDGKRRTESGPTVLIQSSTGNGYVDLAGNVFDFGSPNGTQVQTVTDVFGNETRYEYDAGDPDMLTAVSYDKFMGGAGADYATRIELVYGTVPAGVVLDVDVTTGAALRRTKRLEFVVVKNHRGGAPGNWGPVVRYKLEYGQRGQRQLLSKVTKQGGEPIDGSGTLLAERPTEFTYEAEAEYALGAGTEFDLVGIAGSAGVDWADVDGDGRPDLTWWTASTQYWARNLTTPGNGNLAFGGTQVLPGWGDLVDFNGDGVMDRLTVGPPCSEGVLGIRMGQRSIAGDGTVSVDFSTLTCVAMTPGIPDLYGGLVRTDPLGGVRGSLLDLNADGVLDWVEAWDENGETGGWRVHHGLWTGTAWTFGDPVQLPASNYGDLGYPGALLGGGTASTPPGAPDQFRPVDRSGAFDMNGDGFPDFVNAEVVGSATQWTVRYLTRDGLASSPANLAFEGSASGFAVSARRWVTDLLDGTDGDADCVPGTWIGCALPKPGLDQSRLTAMAIDVDGDGLSDVLTRTASGEIQVWWNRGDRFVPGTAFPLPAVGSTAEDVYPHQAHMYPGKVCGYCDNPDYIPGQPNDFPQRLDVVLPFKANTSSTGRFMDMNGDGIPGYVRVVNEGGVRPPPGGAFFPGVGGSNRMKTVTIPTGATYSVGYVASAKFDGSYAKASRFVVSEVSVLGPALERLPSSSWHNRTRYWYKAPVTGASWTSDGGKSPRGFNWTWVEDDASQIVRMTTWAVESHVTSGSARQVVWGPATSSGTATQPPTFDTLRAHNTTFMVKSVGSSTCLDATEAANGASGAPYIAVPTYAMQARYIGGTALMSTATQSCADVDDYGNPTRITVAPVDGGGNYQIRASYDSTATCKNCPVETWTSADGSQTSAVRHAKYFYSDGANSRYALGTVGVGRLKFVSRKANASTWEVASSTNYFANGNPQVVQTGDFLESGGNTTGTHWMNRTFTYDAFGLRVTNETATDSAGSVILLTDTEYETSSGLPRKVTGPYVSGSAAPKAVKTMAYDALGRPVAVGRGISAVGVNPTTITDAVSVVVYPTPASTLPLGVKTHSFAAPVTLSCDQAGACSGFQTSFADVKESVAYLDGLGRTIQVRERMGGSGTSSGNPANVTQALSSSVYRVSGSVLLDGVGRTTGVLEAFYSSAGNAFQAFSTIKDGGRRGSFSTFDSMGRVSCALSGVYAAAVANAAACTQSDADDLNYRTSVRFTYALGSPIGGVQTMTVTATAGNAIRGTVTSYDAGARALRVVDPMLSKVVTTYDLLGQPLTVTRKGPTDQMPQTVTTTYDLLGRVTEIADPNWLASGQPASAVTDAYGRGRRTMEYFSHGGVKKLTLPALEIGGGATLRPYVTTTYGSLLRKTAVVTNEPKYVSGLGWTFASRTSSFTYDAPYGGDSATYPYVAGRMASAVNEVATIAFGYDQDGTPKERDEWFAPLGSTRYGASIATANDGRAVQAQFTSLGSPTISYSLQYDSFGQPVGVVGANSGATILWKTTTTATDGAGAYDALGRISDTRGYVQSNGGTVTTKRTYGSYSGQLLGQETKLGTTDLYRVGSMGYLGEKLTQMTDAGTGTSYAWAYDTGGRLVTATATANTSSDLTQNYSHSFGFTPVWNLATANVSWNGTATSSQGYTYSGTDQATQAPGGYQPSYALTHDGMGNIIDRRVPGSPTPAETLTYTAEGYLRSIVRGTSTDEVLYYDALGNLAYRRSGTYLWFYAGEHATITATTTCTTDPCAPTAGPVKVSVHVLLAGARIATVRTTPGQTADQAFGTVIHYHRDRQGSVVATTTTGGVLGAQYRYGPYGELDRYAGNEATAGSDLGYTGGLRLTGGLIHLRARVYDPSFRRFIQADVVDPLRYTYTNGDPTNYIDPTGRAPSDGNGRTNVLAGDGQVSAHDGDEPNWCKNEQDNFCVEGVNGEPQVVSTGKAGLRMGTPQFYVDLYVFWTTDKYKKRAARDPSREYLLGFAYRYALRFSQMADETASESFRDVLNATLLNLQVLLLRRIGAYPALLDDPEKLGRAAFLTHVGAYEAGGFPGLRLDQKAELLNALGGKDMFTYGPGVAARVLLPGLWMGIQNPPLPGLQPYP